MNSIYLAHGQNRCMLASNRLHLTFKEIKAWPLASNSFSSRDFAYKIMWT